MTPEEMMQKAQEAADAAKDAAAAAQKGDPADEAALQQAKDAAQEAINKAQESISQNMGDNPDKQQQNMDEMNDLSKEVGQLDSSNTPLDRQREKVSEAADRAEAARDEQLQGENNEEMKGKAEEAVSEAENAFNEADMSDPPQVGEVQRAKDAAQEAVNDADDLTLEEKDDLQDRLDAIPDQEDAIRKAFEETGLPEDLYEDFKAGWEEFMDSLLNPANAPLQSQVPESNQATNIDEWLNSDNSRAAYYVNVATGEITKETEAPKYGSDKIMIGPFNTGIRGRQGQPVVVPTVLEGVEEWYYQSGGRRENLIREKPTSLRIKGGKDWEDRVESMRFFEVDTDGDDLIVEY
jgi:hypothetical protein